MAYIGIVSSQFIPNGNYITVNGSDPVRVQNGYYKVSGDNYTVVVHSANGQAWECEGSVRDYGTRSACMNIRLAQDRDGHIIGMQYAVFDMTSAQEFGAMTTAKELKLEYSSRSKSTSASSSDLDDMAWLEEMEQSEANGGADVETKVSEQRTTTAKKGGTGWIVFGVLCLAAAIKNADTPGTLIICGAVGAISLIFGVMKKM